MSKCENLPALLKLKRDGGTFSQDQIKQLVNAIVDGSLEDAQLGSFLMAVFFRGMTHEETGILTRTMAESGFRFTWPDKWTVGDKHSTGGVGDKVSLILAPALAVYGLKVPMISGRGLGYTGGTLDKLESIPGFRVNLTESEIKNVLGTVGCCIVGQTATLVPADRRMYATRDVTSTVDSLPLVVSSILSKKYAETLDGLVLDVKCGCGGFQPTQESAQEMANALVQAATSLKLRCTALITDMNNPLGMTIGNSLEVVESLVTLRGRGPKDLEDLVCKLGGELLSCTKGVASEQEGESFIKKSLHNGTALKKFNDMIKAQGVSEDIADRLCFGLDDYECLPKARYVTNFKASKSGYIKQINALTIAHICMDLGTSRKSKSDSIKHGVGVRLMKTIGDKIEEGAPWVEVHHDEELPSAFSARISSSLDIQAVPVEIKTSRVLSRISNTD